MAGSVNKVILIGNLGKDPEIRRLENGAVVASFPIATSESYTDKTTGERRETTDWHNIVLWRGLAEVAEKYARKGTKVYIEGRLKTRSWNDKDGNQRYTTEILGDNMTLLTPRGENEGNSGGGAQPYTREPQQDVTPMGFDNSQMPDDDLPF